LLELHAVPPRTAPQKLPAGQDWQRSLFQAAGLEHGRLSPTAAQRYPPVFADERRAWKGAYPEQPDLPIRVEAAACDGRPVYFYLGPEDLPDRLSRREVPEDVTITWREGLFALFGPDA